MNTVILIQLILAHILTDFVFQPDSWVEKKNRSGAAASRFWIHIFLSGLLPYLLLQQWSCFAVPLFIMITHGLIDYWKITRIRRYGETKKRKYFILDQLLHLFILLLAWLYLTNSFVQVVPFLQRLFSDQHFLSLFTAVIFLIWPAGIAIERFTESFRKQIDTSDSLKKAGMYIGILERLLVFLFILLGQYAAIGFLIAAKSILRVTGKDNDSRKKTEYVLIGTLLSFTTAILTGLAVKGIIH